MFAAATRPQGPSNTNPPAKFRPGKGCPRFCGVWQSSQPPISTKYLPRRTAVDTSGSDTGDVTGSGALRIKYLTGKIISVGGRGLRTGATDLKYTTIEARSSSERFR